MEIGKLPMAIVGITIAVIVCAVVLIPVVQESTQANDTFTNDGYFRMTKISSTDDDITITWDYTKPYVFTVNGVDANIPYGSTTGVIFPYSVMSSSDWGLRFTSTNNGNDVNLTVFDSLSIPWSVSTSSSKNATITLSSGTISFLVDGGTAYTESYDTVFIPDDSGDYIMKKATTPVYVNGDSEICVSGRTTLSMGGSNKNYNINVDGTIDDGFTPTIIHPASGVTTSNVVVTSTQDAQHINLYQFDKVTFDVTDGDDTKGATYSQMIVPYQVTAERSVHPDTTTTQLINVIPILVIIGIVMLAVGTMIYYRR